jgi:hypothetical protein
VARRNGSGRLHLASAVESLSHAGFLGCCLPHLNTNEIKGAEIPTRVPLPQFDP